MAELLGLAALAGVVIWLFGRTRRRATPAPEDDVETPVDEALLADAERELEEDPEARPLHDGLDSEDAEDWGPGTR
jgi:hypothetical protein